MAMGTSYGFLGLLLLVIPMLILSSSSQATSHKFYVGGNEGWVLKPKVSYNFWAERTRFQVNDTLYFKYNVGYDSVLVVKKEDYDSCNTMNPLHNMDNGDSEFLLDKSGPFFFISGKVENCKQGLKLIVVVLSLIHHKPWSPSPASAPAWTPSPPAEPPTWAPATPATPPAWTPSPKPWSPSPASSPAWTPSPPAEPPTWAPATPPAWTPSPKPWSPSPASSPAWTPSPPAEPPTWAPATPATPPAWTPSPKPWSPSPASSPAWTPSPPAEPPTWSPATPPAWAPSPAWFSPSGPTNDGPSGSHSPAPSPSKHSGSTRVGGSVGVAICVGVVLFFCSFV